MSVTIHPTAIVDPKAKLGEHVEIGPYCIVEANAVLSDHVKLIAHVCVGSATQLGARCTVYPFTALGYPPQDLKFRGEDTKLVIGDDNVIREHVTMHPGTAVGRGETRVGSGGLFMVGSHIAHDCTVGEKVVMANNAVIGGHVTVGDFVFMGGLCAVHQHTRIGRQAFIGGMATVTKDVIPFGSVVGNHAHLAGLNIVGLKRRGFTNEQLHELRSAYRLLFAEEGTFQERLADVAEEFAAAPAVMEIIDFIRSDAARALCMPE